VEGYGPEEAAERAGVSVEELGRMVELGIFAPDPAGRFGAHEIRRAGLISSITGTGIALDDLATAMREGRFSLDFLDQPAYDRFSALSDITYAQLAERTKVPVELLMLVREAAGSPPPHPGDRVREGELAYADFLEAQIEAGFRPTASRRLLRVQGDSLRRMAETEGEWWRSEVLAPAKAAGVAHDHFVGPELSNRLTELNERAVIELYRLLEAKTWTTNILESIEIMLADAGLYSRLVHPPAMCFLDITGYTRLTQEQGDAAAADLAATLGMLVERTSVRNGGRPVKWLGDGVMLHFRDPGPGVLAALEMVAGVAEAGLPPAHVGLHAGPVIFQEGDYYGQTVNIASRIADYARPGEVLVSQEVVEASGDAGVGYREIGPVELKGVAGAVRLHAASLPA
jgi:adenylate cyclase